MNANGESARANREHAPPAASGELPDAPAEPRSRWVRLRRKVRRAVSPTRIAATFRFAAGLVREQRRRRAETRLTVGVDVNALYEPLTGVGWYLFQLLAHLADRDDVRLRLYAHRLVVVEGKPSPVVDVPIGPALEWVRHQPREDMNLSAGLAGRLLRRLASLCVALDHNDVLFAPNFLAPPIFALSSSPLVATIHDLTLDRLPDAVRPDTRRALARDLEGTLRRARLLLTDSEAVRRELIERGEAPAKVIAAPLGPGQAATSASSQSDSPAPRGRYVLFVGTLEPRKNVGVLLDAWPELARLEPSPPRLVLSGGTGWGIAALEPRIAEGIRAGWLVRSGYVSPAELATLYRGAECLVLPTHYEGFGLPVLEAMTFGVPVVCSDLPVLRELAGDAAVFVPTGSSGAAWAAAIRRTWTEPASRQRWIELGAEQARAFSWEATAVRTLDAWRRVAGQRTAAALRS